MGGSDNTLVWMDWASDPGWEGSLSGDKVETDYQRVSANIKPSRVGCFGCRHLCRVALLGLCDCLVFAVTHRASFFWDVLIFSTWLSFWAKSSSFYTVCKSCVGTYTSTILVLTEYWPHEPVHAYVVWEINHIVLVLWVAFSIITDVHVHHVEPPWRGLVARGWRGVGTECTTGLARFTTIVPSASSGFENFELVRRMSEIVYAFV